LVLAELLAFGTALLEGRTDSPRADALLLLAHATGRTREWMLAHDDAPISPQQETQFSALCDRRAGGVPIAYLLGSAEFYGRQFVVNEDVLVPRPETEHLIDEALRFVKRRTAQGAGNLTLVDVGLGSGAIACTIAAETNLRIYGTEISPAALAVAQENAKRLGVAGRCRFWLGPLTLPVPFCDFDVVIANLPYIPTRDLPKRPDPASFEPRLALDGGRDGLLHYRKLLRELPARLTAGSLALLECAPPTAEKLANLVCLALPSFAVSIGYDYAGLARYIKANDSRSRIQHRRLI
jgi:release factor glutamine methyltransferase